MKRKVLITIALVLSVATLSLIKSDSPAMAESPKRFVTDTGVIALGADQSLRITVVRSAAAESEDGPPVQHIVQFRQMTYAETDCTGPVCKQAVTSVSNSGLITLLPGEASWATFPNGIVRGMVLTNRPDVVVNVMIIDTATGEILSVVQKTDAATPLL